MAMPVPHRSSCGARPARAWSAWRPAWPPPARCCAATATPTRHLMTPSRTSTHCRTWPAGAWPAERHRDRLAAVVGQRPVVGAAPAVAAGAPAAGAA
ncbi:hypothetical protein G6F46_015250 [Rhizopus delemar]|nr:hypothetical protein G6F46_015250 [Rhizopus delemar]